MRALLSWVLHRVAGADLARDIEGDMAESGAGVSRLIAIAAQLTARRCREAMAEVWRSGSAGAAIGSDLRYAVRAVRRSPWYSLTVIGVIALSMALATTVFAVVDGVLFKPLPYPQAQQLYSIQPGFASLGRSLEPLSVSGIDIANWSAAAPDVGITGFWTVNYSTAGETRGQGAYLVAHVQPNIFDVVGVRPMIGGFAASDFHGDADHPAPFLPAVISYSVWQSRFLGAADVIGRTIIADAVRQTGFRVVGVMPQGFQFPTGGFDVDLLTPPIVPPKAFFNPRVRAIREVIARAPAGMSVATLRGQIEAGMSVTAATFPAPAAAETAARPGRMSGPYDRAHVVPLSQFMGSRERPVFAAIFIAAIILVSLGALNVSGLLAARCLDRARELTLRRALGAGGMGIARLIVLEASLLITAGCALGIAIAPSLLRVGLTLLPSRLSLLKTPAIDWRVAGFVALSAIVLAVPTTIWPIRRALRMRVGSLADGNQTSERRRSIGRSIVIGGQVAGAVILTVFGALLVTSVLALYVRSPNVATDNVVQAVAIVEGAGGAMGSSVERGARVGSVLQQLSVMPGVTAAAAMSAQTLRGGQVRSWFNPPQGAANPALDVTVLGGTPEIFRVLGLQLVAGRLPTSDELAHADSVVIVGDLVARAYFPEGSAVGQVLTYGDDARPFRVVGVVKDVRWQGMDQPTGNIYGPFETLSRSPVVGFYLRVADGSVGSVRGDLTRVIEATDPLIQPRPATTLAERFEESIRARRLQAWLFGSFATSALTIVGVGIFGLMAMAMARRGREVGIRMALGSSRAETVSALMREQLSAVMIGLVAGAGIAAWAVRFMSWFLYGLGPYNVMVWAVAIITILGTASIGALIPSLRASRIDPVRALREE